MNARHAQIVAIITSVGTFFSTQAMAADECKDVLVHAGL
jgi:hypothetical protein